MDAGFGRLVMCAFAVACFAAPAHSQYVMVGARGPAAPVGNARTQNFLVSAPTQELAQTVAKEAERFRDELAMYWLGRRLQPWQTPCPIQVIEGPNLAAEGVTQYDRGTARNFQMQVKGTRERILDSVLPHEVTHTVLATHFGGPLPRWADEGICTTVEHAAERDKHERKLREFLSNRRGIAMNELFLLTEYPPDMLPMYAQGYSVCRFLIEQSGPRKFVQFLSDYMARPSWTDNVRKHYGYDSLRNLQENWLAWVAAGSGPVTAYVSTSNRQTQPSRQAQTGQNQPSQVRPGPAPAPAPTRIASNERGPERSATAASPSAGDSWYKRRREQTARGELAAARPTTEDSSFTPPSVSDEGYHSVSQPRPEEIYGERPTPVASPPRQPARPRTLYR